MKRIVRRKLEMVSRVREFCRSHPIDIDGYIEAMARLEDRMARAEALAVLQGTGFLHQSGSTRSKAVIREEIRERHLRHLVRIARGAAGDVMAITCRFRLPKKGINGQAFASEARAMLGQAAEYRALFIKDGMPPTFIEDIHKLLAEYEGAVTGQYEGTAWHVGAVAKLPAWRGELCQLVKRLDAINQMRFQHDAGLLEPWDAARRVSWPGAGAKAVVEVAAEEAGEVMEVAGEVMEVAGEVVEGEGLGLVALGGLAEFLSGGILVGQRRLVSNPSLVRNLTS